MLHVNNMQDPCLGSTEKTFATSKPSMIKRSYQSSSPEERNK